MPKGFVDERGGGGGAVLGGDDAGEVGFAACLNRFGEGCCHGGGVAGFGDGGVEEDGVVAHFHGGGGVGGGADAGVDDEGFAREAIAQELEGVGVVEAAAGADGGAPGHKGVATEIAQAVGEDEVIGHVREDFEAVFDEGFGGLE